MAQVEKYDFYHGGVGEVGPFGDLGKIPHIARCDSPHRVGDRSVWFDCFQVYISMSQLVGKTALNCVGKPGISFYR